MVLEQFLDRKFVIKHLSFIFIISALYVFVAHAVTYLFFPGQSVATVLLVTILLVPSLHHLIGIEERIERTGSSHFWKRHRTIIKCYVGAFLGLLVGFLVLGNFDIQALEYQLTQLAQDHLRPERITAFTDSNYVPTFETVTALFSHNIGYLLIGFVLSLFYGAGAVFLVAYNASFFAAFILELFTRWSSAATLAMVSLVHLIPESAGYIFTAIAGATLSRAIIHEKLGGKAFKNVLRNCMYLLMLAVVFIFLAAIVETYITAPVFHASI